MSVNKKGRTPSPFGDNRSDGSTEDEDNKMKYWVAIIHFGKVAAPNQEGELIEETYVFKAKFSREAHKRAEKFVDVMKGVYPPPNWTIEIETWQEGESWLRDAAMGTEELRNLEKTVRK